MRFPTVIVAAFFLMAFPAFAQTMASDEFSVQSFRRLEWDLDARSGSPVLDQNGKKSALIKVITNAEGLDFDVGVMGVAAVRQEVGEVWVYVPEKVRKITIRHKDYGVIRDYIFPEPVESAVTYEMVLRTPAPEKEVIVKDSIVYVPSSVDSSSLHRRLREPAGVSVSAVFSLPEYSGGLFFAWERYRFGCYLKAMSDFHARKHEYNCKSDGTAESGYVWTTGRSSVSRFNVTTGIVFRTCGWLGVYAGAGYGSRVLRWEDSTGVWAKVEDCSYAGIAVDAGVRFHWRRLCLSAGMSSVCFRTLSADLSVGFMF